MSIPIASDVMSSGDDTCAASGYNGLITGGIFTHGVIERGKTDHESNADHADRAGRREAAAARARRHEGARAGTGAGAP